MKDEMKPILDALKKVSKGRGYSEAAKIILEEADHHGLEVRAILTNLAYRVAAQGKELQDEAQKDSARFVQNIETPD